MALPTAAPQRQLKHRRSIEVQVYSRDDGLWEVDARIADVSARAVQLVNRLVPAGEPMHDMLLRLVVDESFQILDAGAQTFSMPYPGACDTYGDVYRRMIGLNLMKGFRRALKERLGGVQGCTHITELAQVLPTAVVQGFGEELFDRRRAEPGEQPFEIDRCLALRADGPTVREFYPRWYRRAGADESTDAASAARGGGTAASSSN